MAGDTTPQPTAGDTNAAHLEHLRRLSASTEGLAETSVGEDGSRRDLGTPSQIARTLSWALEQIAPSSADVLAAQRRCRSEVEHGRLDELDEWVLEYAREHSRDPFVREMANRAADRRDED